MKIAIFTDQFYPELSGISDSATMLGTALAKRGHSIVFVAPHYSKKDFKKADRLFSELDYGADLNKEIKTIRLPSLVYPNSPTSQSRITIPLGPIGGAYRKLKEFKPDVIHTQSPFGAGIDALMASKFLKVPLVGTNHTPIVEFMSYSPFHPKWFVEIFVRYYSWYYNRCRFVSAPCNALLEDMMKHGFKKIDRNNSVAEKSLAISNPVPLDAFRPVANIADKMALKRRFGFSNHTVLFAGRLAEEKHVDVIIRAIKQVQKEIPDATLAITGHGSAAESLKKLTIDLGLQDTVKFLGYVDFNVFPLIYQASDIFAVTSTAETQCISLMQAFACGIPAIAVKAWGLPEYVGEDAGIVIEPGNPEVLARTIIDLFKNSAEMEKMGKAGMQSVKKYEPDVVAETWEQIYSTYVEKR